MGYDWKNDGHAVWWEENYGPILEHPDSCMKEVRICYHHQDGEIKESPVLGRFFLANDPLHTNDDCPNPFIYRHPDCGFGYDAENVGLEDLWEEYRGGDREELVTRLEGSISHDPDNPTPIEYWFESCHTPSTPMGPEEWWTECQWRIAERCYCPMRHVKLHEKDCPYMASDPPQGYGG
jgi:hypothetical protein